MTDIYNTTNLSVTTGIYEWATQVNILTEGWFALVLLFSFFVIINIIFRQYDTKVVALTATFSTVIIALMLFMIAWITMATLLVTFALLAVSIIAQLWRIG